MQQALNQIKTLMVEGINQKTIALTVLATLAFVGFMNFAHAAEFAQYGTIAQEDQLAVYHDGNVWINTLTNTGIGNGQFYNTGLDNDYSIDQAIAEFGIYEDTQAFIVEPVLSNGKFSNILMMFELDEDLQFQLTHVYEDESGIDKEVTQLENNI